MALQDQEGSRTSTPSSGGVARQDPTPQRDLFNRIAKATSEVAVSVQIMREKEAETTPSTRFD